MLANQLLIFQDAVEALDFLFGTGAYAGQEYKCLPKVILLDLKLSKMSGLEVLRQIKSDDRTKMVPVVMLTSSEQESDIFNSYALGANSYVVKPVDFDKFSLALLDLGAYGCSRINRHCYQRALVLFTLPFPPDRAPEEINGRFTGLFDQLSAIILDSGPRFCGQGDLEIKEEKRFGKILAKIKISGK